jgi:uncharacterized membrane protein
MLLLMRFVSMSHVVNLNRALRILASAMITMALAAIVCADPAAADFRMCNNTASRVGVAIGYKDAHGWNTEGWWNLPPRSCETLMRGRLVARYYYLYAIDYDRGGDWSGQSYMCTRPKEFTIHGTENCLARGFDRTGFFEVDTGEQRAWTVQLTDAAEPVTQSKATAPIPMLTVPPPTSSIPPLPPSTNIRPANP